MSSSWATTTPLPSTVGDLRIAFLRFLFNFTPQSYGVDQTKFGLPESYNAQEPLRNNPDPCVAGFSDFLQSEYGSYRFGHQQKLLLSCPA